MSVKRQRSEREPVSKIPASIFLGRNPHSDLSLQLADFLAKQLLVAEPLIAKYKGLDTVLAVDIEVISSSFSYRLKGNWER